MGALLPLTLAAATHNEWRPPEEFWFHGRVFDDDTEAGLANASLTLYDPWDQEVASLTSGPGGQFGGLVDMGDYRVRVERTGYYGLDSWMGEWWSDNRWEEYGLFPLPTPNATVAGHINATGGGPLAGVEVLLNRDGVWHDRGEAYYGRMITNATGNYSFDVAPGNYNLRVVREGYFEEGWGFTANNGSALYHNFTLEAYTESALLRGYLNATGGGPAVPAQVELQHERGYRNQTFAAASGYYEMYLAPGNYSGYNVWGEGYDWQGNSTGSGWAGLTLAANSTTWFNLTVQPAPDEIFVSGTVYDMEKQPVENATVKVVSRQKFYGLNPGDYYELEGLRNTTTTGTNGNFLLQTYRWGNQHLEVTAPGYYSTEEWWYDSGRNNSLMELFIGPAQNATISGRVTYPNSTGAANYFVEFRQIHEGGSPDWVWLNNGTYTNATGYYSLDYWGLRSEVWVHANASHRFGRYEYYEHPHTFPSGSSTFDITLGYSSQDNIVKGYVLNPNGTGLANISVYGSNWWGFEETVTNTTGYYELNMVSDRENWLDVWYRPRFWEYPLLEEGYNQFYFADSGETLWYNITLGRRAGAVEDATVYGYVYAHPNGTALPYAQVRVNSLNEEHRWWSNWTETNASGYFELGLPGGEFELWADYPGYFPNRTRSFVWSGSTVNEDLTLTPYPPRDATLKGYVKDSGGIPLKGLLFWGHMLDKRLTHMRDNGGSLAPMFDKFESYAFDTTFSDNATGYYELAVPAGRLYTGVFDLSGSAEGSKTNFIDIAAGSELWLNYTLANYTAPAYTLSGQVFDEQGWPLDWDTEVLLLKQGDFRGDTGLHLGPNGTFSFAVTPGDYVLLVDRHDRDTQIRNITITTSNYYTTFNLSYPNTTLLERGVDFPLVNDWDNGTLYANVTTYEDVKLARFMVDYYLGNNDGTIDATEAAQVAADIFWDLYGSQPSLLPGSTSYRAFNVDGRHYRVDGSSFTLSVSGAIGPVNSTVPLVVIASQNISSTAPVPANDPHTFRAYTTYDEQIMEQSYWVSPPPGWRYQDDNDPENVAVTGTDPVKVDPLGDPKPWDEIFEVIVDLYFESTMPRLAVSWSPTFVDNATNLSFTVTAEGLPATGAWLNLTGFSNGTRVANLTTNATGGAAQSPLPPGQYWVTAEKTGHKAAKKLLTVYEVGALMPMELAYSPFIPDDRTEILFTLTNLSSGRVAGASVRAVRLSDNTTVWSGYTNASGQVATTLPAGEYYINATAANHTNATLYLEVLEAKKSLVITVNPLYATIGMDIWVLVSDDLGNPMANVTLNLTWANNGSLEWTGTTGANGSALLSGSLGLGGQYILTAELPPAMGYEPDNYSLTIHPLDEHNPEREGDSFLPGFGSVIGGVALVGVAVAMRRQQRKAR